MAGGKLTTYRAMAEEAVDRLGTMLGRALLPCRTDTEPL
jgi:glycerol-3-phosphate dehydrogenase